MHFHIFSTTTTKNVQVIYKAKHAERFRTLTAGRGHVAVLEESWGKNSRNNFRLRFPRSILLFLVIISFYFTSVLLQMTENLNAGQRSRSRDWYRSIKHFWYIYFCSCVFVDRLCFFFRLIIGYEGKHIYYPTLLTEI